MKKRTTKKYIYYTEENQYGKSKDYDIRSTDEENERRAEVVKIYDWSLYEGGRYPTGDWRVDLYGRVSLKKSKVGSYNEVMKIARGFIDSGRY